MGKNKYNTMFLGKVFFYLFSISWLLISLYGFFYFGWLKQLTDVTPVEFVIQFSALLFPVFVFFLIGAYWDKNRRIVMEAQAIRGYLDELIYPTDKGKKYISHLTAELKDQIGQFKEVFDSMSRQTEGLRDDLCQWIGDLNTIINHVDEQTLGSIQKISNNMQTLADATETANGHVVDSVQALATSADILNQVTEETIDRIKKASDSLKDDTEEIKQTAHASVQAQTQIEDALDKSGKMVSVLTENTRKMEHTLSEMDKFKDFIKTTDTIALKLKEMSTTLDMRLDKFHTKTKEVSKDLDKSPIKAQEINTDFMKQLHLIMEQLQSASVEVAQALKPKDEELLWEKYYAGDKTVFIRSIGDKMSPQKRQKVIDLYNKNKPFKSAVDAYKKAFEDVSMKIKETKEDNVWLGVLVGSDVGRLYMLLVDILKGQTK